MGARDYSTTAASNLSVGGISLAEGMARASVNNGMRQQLADIAGLLLDLGGETATTGTGTAFLLSLPSSPTAYADNLSFVCKLHTAVTGAATININGLGVKPLKKLMHGVPTDLVTGDGPAGHRASCIYSSSANAVLMLNAGGAAPVYFVDDITTAKALPGLQAGASVFVGNDQFIVVDDPTLGTDGGTVFIPDSELSSVYSEVIPDIFSGVAFGDNVNMEYALDHTGIDFESVQLVVSDPNALFPEGETLDVWMLHGHVMQSLYSERGDPDSPGFSPQLPKIDTGRGMFRDPGARLTIADAGVPLRTGGALLRYKYATSGLRLKRITGPVFRLDWWPVVAVEDEAPGEQTDNHGRICWCANAAAAARAEAVFVDKMYYYGRCIEWPENVELRGYGPGLSGFRVMDNAAYTEVLLSTSRLPDSSTKEYSAPWTTPATRQWLYDATYSSQAPTLLPASGARRLRIRGIELDGNALGNLGLFASKGPAQPGIDGEGPLGFYAYGYASANIHTFNAPYHTGIAITDQSNRVIPDGMILELHNVKVHGYHSHCILGNHHCNAIGTGVVEVGDTGTGHWLYHIDGVYETVKVFGYCSDDGLRVRKFIAKRVEMVLAPLPAAFYDTPTYPNSGGVGTFVDQYMHRTMVLISYTELIVGNQDAGHGSPAPGLPKAEVVIDSLLIDATGMEASPAPQTAVYPFQVSGDNFTIKSSRIRLGRGIPALLPFIQSGGNALGGTPIKNWNFENMLLEYGSRVGINFCAISALSGGLSQSQFKNITLEPRSTVSLPGDPAPTFGVGYTLGTWAFNEVAYSDTAINEGKHFDFSAVTLGTFQGSYIDLTPPDDGAPTYRIWFSYSGASAPAAGGATLVAATTTPSVPTSKAHLAAAFAKAIEGVPGAYGVPATYLSAQASGTKAAVGAWSNYRYDTGYTIAHSVTNAPGVAVSYRTWRRNYEPAIIGFERFLASDPIFLGLMNIPQSGSVAYFGANRDVTFTFKDCVLGAYIYSNVAVGASGSLATAYVDQIKDQLHCYFENTILDVRDGAFWSNLDLLLYTGKFRNCRIRTPSVGTTATLNAGLTNIGTGYETLFSEQGGIYTGTPGPGVTTVDIQTKLFWVPKDGNVRIYPADAATAVVWNSNMPSVSWVKSARPISSTYTALGGSGAYYQGPASISEDRRAPALRLTFATAPATALAIGWSAAVSP